MIKWIKIILKILIIIIGSIIFMEINESGACGCPNCCVYIPPSTICLITEGLIFALIGWNIVMIAFEIFKKQESDGEDKNGNKRLTTNSNNGK